MQSVTVSLTFHTVAKPEIQVALNSLSPSHPHLPQLRALWGSPLSSKEKPKWSLRPWPCCLLPIPGTAHPRAFALAVESSSFHQLNSLSSQPKSFFVPEASSDQVSVQATELSLPFICVLICLCALHLIETLTPEGWGFLPCSPESSAVPGPAGKLRPANILNLVQPMASGHQRFLAEDTSGSFGAIHSGWSVLCRSDPAEAGAWNGERGPRPESLRCPHGTGQRDSRRVEQPRRAGQLSLTPRQRHVVSPWH